MIEAFCQPWAITPAGWQQIQEILVRLNGVSQNVTAKRPTQDFFGNELPTAKIVNGIGVVPVQGPMMKGAHPILQMFGIASHDNIRDDLLTVLNQGVRGIFMPHDSPGGTMKGTPELAEFIGRISQQMPVVSWTDSTMASASYYLAAPSTIIAASPSSTVGSIGTIMEREDWSGFFESLGIKVDQFTSGKYKGMGHPGVPLTDEQRGWLQERVENQGEQFKDYVAQNRPNVDPAGDTMEGQWFTGTEAVQRGLADTEASTMGEAMALFG